MVDLLALLDDDTVLQLISGKADSGSSYLFTIHQDTALHDQAAGLAVGSGQTGLDHEGQDADGAIGQIRFGQLSGGHVLSVGSTAEQGTGSVLSLLSFFLAVPTMAGASLIKVLKFGLSFTSEELLILGIGCVSAFIVSIIAIKTFIGYIKQHSFTAFGWYRIILGALVAVYFLLK